MLRDWLDFVVSGNIVCDDQRFGMDEMRCCRIDSSAEM
jgi:hypothetical protein